MTLVRFFDYIGKKTGRYFGIIFKTVIPFLVMVMPIYYVTTALAGGPRLIVDVFLWAGFIAMLVFAPKAASGVEFFVIGFALVFAFGFGMIQHMWEWGILAAACIFLFFKILFFVNIMVKKADELYEQENGPKIIENNQNSKNPENPQKQG